MDHGVPRELFADEIARLSLLSNGPQRPDYAQLELTGPAAPGPGLTLSNDDIDGAVAELAERRGEPYGDTWAAVRALAAGERDTASLAAAIVTLARDPESGTVALAASDPTPADRREYAARGWALPDGSYPIGNAAQLRAAAILAASGHGDVEAARKLIRRRAEELGVDVSTLPGFREESTVRLTDFGNGDLIDPVTLAAVTVPEGYGTADEICARYPEIFGVPLHRSGAEVSGKAVKPGRPSTTRTRAHVAEEEHISDTRQPARGGVVHPDVARYLGMLDDPRVMSGRERPRGAVVVHHPYRGRR